MCHGGIAERVRAEIDSVRHSRELLQSLTEDLKVLQEGVCSVIS